MSKNAAIITVSSGKSAEVLGAPGIFSCLLQHEVTKTKASVEYTGPKMKPELWAQIMEFFEWTYAKEKSEAQVRLFVHPERGWAAWAFPQEGGTGMTSKELPLDTPEATEQRKQFAGADGWLYWGTVHHHCSAGAFASGTDDANEKSQEGIHITIGHMDKPVRDFHCRLYLKEHKFEPQMEKFWELDGALLDKADECFELWGIYPDLNAAARKAMCQNSTALYNSASPPWVPTEGQTLFPPQWKDNYKVKAPTYYVGGQGNLGWDYSRGGNTTQSRLGGEFWCHKCYKWTDHSTVDCKENNKAVGELSKKDKRKLKWKLKNPPTQVNPNKENKAATLLDDLEAQAAVMGIETSAFYELIAGLNEGNVGMLLEEIITNLVKEKITPEQLLMVILEREIKAEMTEKESDSKAVQEQIAQANGGPVTGWEGGPYNNDY